jgi:hypothetical protein
VPVAYSLNAVENWVGALFFPVSCDGLSEHPVDVGIVKSECSECRRMFAGLEHRQDTEHSEPGAGAPLFALTTVRDVVLVRLDEHLRSCPVNLKSMRRVCSNQGIPVPARFLLCLCVSVTEFLSTQLTSGTGM